MTGWHVINFAIPIVFMVGIGYLIDHISKPVKPKEDNQD
jgi:hypothetical protein